MSEIRQKGPVAVAPPDENVFGNGKPTPEEVLEVLKAGNDRFVRGEALHVNTEAERRQLSGVENQKDHAYATVIACSDSRVPVERIFDAGVMDLFVIRVAGNVIMPATIGSIEYGLAHVHTPVLVVLGHSQCGAVTAAAKVIAGEGCPAQKHIESLINCIHPAVDRARLRFPDLPVDDIIPHAIEENIWHSIEDLFRQSPTVRELVVSGMAKVVGAHYDVSTGAVDWLPEEHVARIVSQYTN